MSAITPTLTRGRRLVPSYRAFALGGAAVLTVTYVAVLYHVVDVVGGVEAFVLEVLVAVAAALVVSRVVGVRGALVLGIALLAGGLGGYVLSVPSIEFGLDRVLADTYALLTGLSVLHLTKADVWALGIAPAPLFVSMTCFLRRRYVLGTVVGGGVLAFFVLTGDLDAVPALAGVLGAVAAVGFGDLDRGDGAGPQRDTLLAVMAAMLVVATTLSVVPGGQANPLFPDRDTATVEGSLLAGEDRVGVLGSIELSPDVRFTVRAEDRAYWRVGAYDRYTGREWVRTGQATPYGGRLPLPAAADRERVVQAYRAESRMGVMPAAWKPVRVTRDGPVSVTDLGGVQPGRYLTANDTYRVVSYVPEHAPRDLRAAGTDYPAAVRDRYLRLPASTPDRVGELAAEVTGDARNPYEAAVAVEWWLESNKQYSLDVSRPGGDVVAGFLFEMDRGYCVYFASAMVAMLRTQDIPARFVVGYTPGQQVDGNTWVVRGLDSHAWVEAYFPEHGWVRFDPTPAGPRQSAERSRLDQARAAGASGVDTDESAPADAGDVNGSVTPGRPGDDPIGLAGGANGSGRRGTPTEFAGPGVIQGTGGDGGGGGIPDRFIWYGLLVLVGAVAAAHRFGLLDRAYREVWLHRPPTGTARDRVEGAYDRVEYLLARRYRPRLTAETPREYVSYLRDRGLDDRAVELYEVYERARYAGEASPKDAATARRLLRGLLRDRSPLP